MSESVCPSRAVLAKHVNEDELKNYQIARLYDVADSTVAHWLTRHGLKRVRKNTEKAKGIELCKDAKCRRINKGQCIGWTDPEYMWKDGRCPHLSHDPKLVVKTEQAIRDYAKKHKGE